MRYVWEFYDYSRVDWERTNTYGRAGHAAQVARLTSKLEQFDACSAHTRDDPVPPACKALTN